jgi:hypothetical protein
LDVANNENLVKLWMPCQKSRNWQASSSRTCENEQFVSVWKDLVLEMIATINPRLAGSRFESLDSVKGPFGQGGVVGQIVHKSCLTNNDFKGCTLFNDSELCSHRVTFSMEMKKIREHGNQPIPIDPKCVMSIGSAPNSIFSFPVNQIYWAPAYGTLKPAR